MIQPNYQEALSHWPLEASNTARRALSKIWWLEASCLLHMGGIPWPAWRQPTCTLAHVISTLTEALAKLALGTAAYQVNNGSYHIFEVSSHLILPGSANTDVNGLPLVFVF